MKLAQTLKKLKAHLINGRSTQWVEEHMNPQFLRGGKLDIQGSNKPFSKKMKRYYTPQVSRSVLAPVQNKQQSMRLAVICKL